jgi:uncharacterized protein (UPF0179 family)
MTREKPTVTLIGIGQARVGRVFIHKGPCSKCEDCKYFQVCVKNVESERVYKIVGVRQKTLPCRLYETEMQVIEVVDAEIPAAIQSKQAIAGAVITFEMPSCKEEICENRELCLPRGLRQGDRCEVLEVTVSLQCSEGSPRKQVLLRRVPIS